jgi:hypothetical protein
VLPCSHNVIRKHRSEQWVGRSSREKLSVLAEDESGRSQGVGQTSEAFCSTFKVILDLRFCSGGEHGVM